MLGVMCLVALLQLVRLFLLVLSVLVFSAYRLCVLRCVVCFWLTGDALLMYPGVVSLRLHLPCFDVCWSFGVAGLGWYPCSRLKQNWSVLVEYRGWGLMTVLNRGFISPGFCSGMNLRPRWRDWM
jgi:hypothetical protein